MIPRPPAPQCQAADTTPHDGAWLKLAAAGGGWFASLPADLQAFLAHAAEPRLLQPGQRLFARGDAPDGLYFLAQGTVRVTGLTERGDEALLAVLEAPQWFGEIALFDGDPRTHDTWAESPARLMLIPQARLHQLLAEQPAHWQHFGRLLTQKLRTLLAGLEDMALLPPTERVARRLADMAAGYGAWTDRTRRVVAVSQEQLGQMLALSRQTVNQALKELETAGAIRRARGAVEILDLARLRGERAQ
jgi:CRP-like cAMP-binding protein